MLNLKRSIDSPYDGWCMESIYAVEKRMSGLFISLDYSKLLDFLRGVEIGEIFFKEMKFTKQDLPI